LEASPAPQRAFLNFSLLKRSDIVGFAGAAVLLGSLFLPWFGTSETNSFSELAGAKGGATVNAFQVYGLLDWLLVAACSAPFVLAWITLRGHPLSWVPGEVTMIVGITAFMLILMNGIILGRPGNSVDISIRYGYVVGMLGALLIMGGGIVRQAQVARVRRPPGTLA
jgi:hypothetical protein